MKAIARFFDFKPFEVRTAPHMFVAVALGIASLIGGLLVGHYLNVYLGA